MNPSLSSLDSLLLTIVLATLAIGLPIVLVLAIRFFWDRSLHLGRSKELEKLIWQLHRIASAMEHQLNLAFSPVQPGTEEPRDLVYLQQPAQPQAANATVATANAAAGATSITGQPATPSEAGAPAAQPASSAQPRRDPAAQPPRAGVNSMFGM